MRGMGTWNRMTDLRGEEGEGNWKKLAKEHICIYAWPMDTDNHVVKARVGVGAGWRRDKVEGVNGGHL